MKNNQPLVSINILTYNSLKYIKLCLDSALNQTYPKVEVLVIDNASADGTPEFIKKNYPDVRLIVNEKNLGFAAGHNLGFKKTKGEFIICLNVDAVLSKNYVEKILECFNDITVGAVQGKLIRLKDEGGKTVYTDIIDTTGLVMFKNRRIINRGQGEKDCGQYNKQEEIFGPDGAAPAYRREALEDIKIKDEYFDEIFFLYKEDIDLAWRLRLAGWKTIYKPNAIAYHFRGAGEGAVKNWLAILKERRKVGERAKYYSFKNQRLMQIKNEIPILFIKHLPRILLKEIASWLYVIIFEKYGFKAIISLFKEIPAALKKRKIIMRKRKASRQEMERWLV